MKATDYIWKNGEWLPWAEATVHVFAHGLHYGSSVFEGIRSYDTPNGPVVFRLREHLRRWYDSARIYRMNIPYDMQQMERVCVEAISRNKLKVSYIRPIAYRGYGSLSLIPGDACPIDVAVGAIAWGPYLGEGSLESGVDTCVTSWTRIAPNTMPTMAKAGGNYLSSQLIAMEAQRHGYAEGICLDAQGFVSEGSGENLFAIRDGVVYTPPLTAGILPGITRDSAIALMRDSGRTVREEPLPREVLYLADEIFMTGTAAEICPVRSVDGINVGEGQPGPCTLDIQQKFFGLFNGETEDKWDWLSPVAGNPDGEKR